MKTDKHKLFQRIACMVLAALLGLSLLGSTLLMLLG